MGNRAATLLTLLLLLAGACAPHVVPPSASVTTAMLADDHIRTTDGAKLPLRVWRSEEPPKAVILGLHGFNDYSKSFAHPAKTWTAEGIAVYAYDQRGFGTAPHPGLWAGTRAMTADLAAVSHLLRERYPGLPLYLVGESMGAAVILAAYGGSNRPNADGVVLSAPAVWARDHMPIYQRAALWIGAHTLPWMKLTGQGLKIRASDNDDMLRALGRDPLVIKATRIDTLFGLSNLMDAALAAAPKLDTRALVLYGREEQLIPKSARQALLAMLPRNGRWRYAEYESGFHMLLRDLNAALVLHDIAEWAIGSQDAPTQKPPEYAERIGTFP